MLSEIDELGPEIEALNKFVLKLDPAVRAEAFKFLLFRHFGRIGTSQENSTAVVTVDDIGQSQSQADRALSPQELLRIVAATSGSDKAVVFGYWLEMHQGQKSFSSGQLKEVFETARENPPTNPSDVVAKLERAGRLMKVEKIAGTQYYRLTRTAVEEIESKIK